MLPTQLRSGDTWYWTDTAPTLPDGTVATSTTYTSKIEFQGQSQFTVTATANGTDFKSAVTAANSKTYLAGFYRWIRYVTLTSDNSTRYTIDTGEVEILPNLATVQGGYDARTPARRALANLDDAMIAWSKNPTSEIEIAGRRKVWSGTELQKMRAVLRQEVANEEKADRMRRGLNAGGKLLERFV